MISLVCPICAEELRASNDVEIERSFKDHLKMVHEVQDFCILDGQGHAEGSIRSCQPEVVRDVEGIPRDFYDRPVFEYSMKDQINHMPRPLPEETDPEKRMLGIRCPVCGAKVEGTDDLDLSNQLRLHFLNDHPGLMEKRLREKRIK